MDLPYLLMICLSGTRYCERQAREPPVQYICKYVYFPSRLGERDQAQSSLVAGADWDFNGEQPRRQVDWPVPELLWGCFQIAKTVQARSQMIAAL